MKQCAFPTESCEADVAVIGGGLAGVCAAVAAARRGARVVLMQDRPVLGGNSSSECRMHICGADRCNTMPHLRETGLLEELRLEALARNPTCSFSLWDLILYEAVRAAPNLTLLLNCSCLDAAMAGNRLTSVTGWQLTTQRFHEVRASIFIDTSGDSVLAPLSGADYRIGREARAEFNESIAPEQADARTMGMTCMFQARRHGRPVPFVPPAWAYRFETCAELPYGAGGHGYWNLGYWWIELGGEQDSIGDTEAIRDELLKIVLGVWDHIKNSGSHDVEDWALEWIQFLPGKRESRRYVGDHILTQRDIEAGGHFDDVVAYGGWKMDDHDPAGFYARRLARPATVFHPAPTPYGIPYRSLYSRNIENLMFAGRNASCTHAAMSSTRVMGTCAGMGQAVGTAAAIAVHQGVLPRAVGEHVGELQQALLADDAYLPGVRRNVAALTTEARLAASAGEPEPVRDGIGRQVGDDAHAWLCPVGGEATYTFTEPAHVNEVVLVLDTAMDQQIAPVFSGGYDLPRRLPAAMPRAFRIDGCAGGTWRPLHEAKDNRRRHVQVLIGQTLEAIRFVLESTWGDPASRIYEFSVS